MGDTIKIAETEYGIEVTKQVLQTLNKMDPECSMFTDWLEAATVKGDALFCAEEKMTDEEKQLILYFGTKR